jgi:2-keto-4-pentenoate hydratase/2-oxohepta-3-ene-1,7-dioic acid hydratase in catechol pathway
MKIATFNGGRIGIIRDEHIVDITDVVDSPPGEWPPIGMNRLIRDFLDLEPQIAERSRSQEGQPLTDVCLEAPVPWPSKIVAYPVNYHDHGQEMGASYRATHQGFFLKPPSSICGPTDVIELPDVPGREVHHESELGIVIGREARDIQKSDWQDYVFGYTCLLDMVVRGKEERVFRKAYDTFCPIGPWIVTTHELQDPTNLDMRLWVNGDLRQEANTRDLVLDIPGMVEMAAAVMTLYPGDIIATGTPAGVGPVNHGDTVRIAIDQIGEMSMPVIQGERGQTIAFEEPYQLTIAKQR